jgi:hypothetical protein
MQQTNGTTWVVENSSSPTHDLVSDYRSVCEGRTVTVTVSCAMDASASDASADAHDEGDAAGDASDDAGDAASPPQCSETRPACSEYDDIDVAYSGLSNVTITRLRADLPVAALAVDLSLGAGSSQATVPLAFQARGFTDPTFNPCSTRSTTPTYAPMESSGCACETTNERNAFGSVSLATIVGIVLARMIRKRR